MAYWFKGVFIERPEKSNEELEALFEGHARRIDTPFDGVVLSFQNDVKVDDAKAFVLEKSKEIPHSKVAYINYSTWGSPAYVSGFACQCGALIEGSEQEKEDDLQNEVLISLLEVVGAKKPSSYFKPFERDFFPNT